jgi:hypothetical protein
LKSPLFTEAADEGAGVRQEIQKFRWNIMIGVIASFVCEE